jgi:hypothetical protein
LGPIDSTPRIRSLHPRVKALKCAPPLTVGLMEHITGWSVWEVLGWLNEKQAIPEKRRYDNAKRY